MTMPLKAARAADAKPTRKPTNVSLDSRLVHEAKDLGVNVSRACESGLSEEVRKARWQKWQQDNQAAIEDYNRHIAKHGLFSDAWRKF